MAPVLTLNTIVEHTETGDIGRVVEEWQPFERVHFEPMVRVYWILTRDRFFHREARERLVDVRVLRPSPSVHNLLGRSS